MTGDACQSWPARTDGGREPVVGHVADPAPRISVIMNVRNGALYLREALDSVLAQTFDDWELVFYDDCSTDGSADILAEYPDPRIRYCRTLADLPLGQVRDLAIREARGEWLAFLDQDDVWVPAKLERQLDRAGPDARIGLVYGRTVTFGGSQPPRDFDRPHEFGPLPEGEIFERLFTESCFIAMSSAMLRRAAVLEVGGIPSHVEVVPDYLLFAAVARRYRARAVQQVVCRYRIHSGSLSRTGARRMQEESIRLVDDWASVLGEPLATRRRRVHATVLAVQDMLDVATLPRGVARLLGEGSVPYLLSRPPAWAARALHRRIITPAWQRHGEARARPRIVPEASGDLSAATRLLSVVIVSWNVRDLLRECLHSIFVCTSLPREALEIVVVDNASGDGSIEMLAGEFPAVRVVANRDNVGFGRANNQALAECSGRYLLLLNPDARLLPGTVDRMLAIAESRPDLGALGCRLEGPDGVLQRWTGGSRPTLATVACHFLLLNRVLPAALLPPPLYLEREPADDAEVGWVSGACMLLRREALRGRLFDDRFFMYGEDLELCQRLAADGWSVIYTPHCAVVHHEGRSLAKQPPDVALHRPRSLRMAFAMYNAPERLWRYDFVVCVGFMMRMVAYGVAAVVRPGYANAARAAMSRRFFVDAWRMLRRRA